MGGGWSIKMFILPIIIIIDKNKSRLIGSLFPQPACLILLYITLSLILICFVFYVLSNMFSLYQFVISVITDNTTEQYLYSYFTGYLHLCLFNHYIKVTLISSSQPYLTTITCRLPVLQLDTIYFDDLHLVHSHRYFRITLYSIYPRLLLSSATAYIYIISTFISTTTLNRIFP